jgi:predicted flap endonuclease-1-like 5' DNA nuclease
MSDAVNTLSWRARYLDARVRYLENEARPKSPAIDPETLARKDWRGRYVERRVRHLQNELKAVRIDANALTAARQRVGEIEAAAAAPPVEAPEGDVKRLRWRERYLDARVRHLESRLAGAGVPLQPAAGMQDAELPIETPQSLMGGGVRPASIAAPRQGAPDDLTLIEGIGPKTEKTLQALGVFHFDQIADWSRANCAWVDQYLRLRGRIERERWVEQARALARGGRQRHQLYLERELV